MSEATDRGALVLGRKLHETIHIGLEDGRSILLQVADLNASRVRIRVEAPKSIVILRGELVGRES